MHFSRVVNYVESFPLEKELEFRQLQDPYLRRIASQLELQERDDFQLINDLVFRKGLDKPSFIPSAMINNLIRIYYDEVAHCGPEKTI